MNDQIAEQLRQQIGALAIVLQRIETQLQVLNKNLAVLAPKT